MYYSIMQYIILDVYGRDDGNNYKVVRVKYFEKCKYEYIKTIYCSQTNSLYGILTKQPSFVALILPP